MREEIVGTQYLCKHKYIIKNSNTGLAMETLVLLLTKSINVVSLVFVIFILSRRTPYRLFNKDISSHKNSIYDLV
jgi:hypothetical protein